MISLQMINEKIFLLEIEMGKSVHTDCESNSTVYKLIHTDFHIQIFPTMWPSRVSVGMD